MKKMILFGAALAALATFTSCSSDDALEDIQQPITEVVPQGKPLTVRVNGETTRGVYASAITGFKMTALTNGNYATNWFEDGEFTKTSAWDNNLTAELKTWPIGQYDFFAVSEDGAAPTTSTVSTSTLTNGKVSFEYTVPTALDEQKDLLVATNIGASEGETGEVPLNFQHALSGIKLLARLAFVDWNGAIYTNSGLDDVVDEFDNFHYGYYVEIDRVEIYGFKSKGTFTFSSTTSTNTTGASEAGSWSEQNTPAAIVLDYSANPLVYIVNAQAGITSNTEAAAYPHVDLLGGDNTTPKMTMVIPQTTTAWTSGTYLTDGSQSYIKLHMKMAYYCPPELALQLKQQYLDDGDNESAAYYQAIYEANGNMGGELGYKLIEGNYFYPIPTKVFSANKTFTLRLLLNRLYKSNGTQAFSGATFNG